MNPPLHESIERLNAVCSLMRKRWKEEAKGIDFHTEDGYITLPREYEGMNPSPDSQQAAHAKGEGWT